MENYPSHFLNIVNSANEKAKNFYRENDKELTPNPYYIGKGNPNAKILVIGKELAIDPVKHPSVFQNESVENTTQWKKIIDEGMNCLEETDFNPLFPYDGCLPKSAGATWNQYQRLCDLLLPKVKVSNESHFFRNFFLTEANTTPSKYSPGRSKIDFKDRLEFLKNEFYQSFDVVVVAAGGYLHVDQIESLFNVKELDRSQSTPSNKFITFIDSETGRKVISTRQLSTSVSSELMKKLAVTINN